AGPRTSQLAGGPPSRQPFPVVRSSLPPSGNTYSTSIGRLDVTTNDLAVVDYAALIRPAIDRVYISMRNAAQPNRQRAAAEKGARPGFISSFYYGLLARPMSAAGFAAAEIYVGADMTEELEQGIATVDGEGSLTLTASGTDLALAMQRAIGEQAQEHWGRI